MADIVQNTASAAVDQCLMSPATRSFQDLTPEDIHYMQKIEELANKMLGFFRKQELRDEHVKETIKKPNVVDVKSSKRPRPTSTTDDRKNNNKKTKKKKVVTKKHVRKPVVRNETTRRMEEFIVNEMKGRDMKLVIQKVLYKSDTRKNQNRLSMPINQLETDEFLTAEEKMVLNRSAEQGNEIAVRLLGPTLEMYENPINLRKWHMENSVNYVLTTKWYRFRVENKVHLKKHSTIQVWSFRGDDGQLCFAVAGVEIPEGEESEDDKA